MSVKIAVESLLRESGSTPIEIDSTSVPAIEDGDPSHLGSIADKKSVHAHECIYCHSTETGRTDEHVIPRAWGGNLIIFRGACELCRGKTAFEDSTLNDGNMANVRKSRGIQSRSGHKSATETIDVTFVRNGLEVMQPVPTSSAPLILGFPWFPPPSLLSGEDSNAMSLSGWLTTSHGHDVEAFLREHGATAMHVAENGKHPVAFARTMAKIAYCYAWVDGVINLIEGAAGLVNAFMTAPETLGQYVGMKPAPFEHFPGMSFRLAYVPDIRGYLCMEVQPFCDVPAPTYLVVLGRIRNMRHWRRLRSQISKGMTPQRRYFNLWLPGEYAIT